MFQNFKFRGLMAPVFTPFNQRGEIDISRIPGYAEYLKKRGIHGVLVNGTTGEGTLLTVTERKQLTEAWAHSCQGVGQTLMVQVGGACLKDVQLLAEHAEHHGVSGLLCLPDLFFRPKTNQELTDYLKEVSRAAPATPLFYYHIPSFTGVNLDMGEFLEETEGISTLSGIKFTHTDLEQGSRCLSAAGRQYTIFLGADQVLSGACTLGFDSAIATTLNLYPEQLQQIMAAVNSGDIKLAQRLQLELNRRITSITSHGSWVSSMKCAMNILSGLKMGEPRKPLYTLTKDHEDQMRTALCNPVVNY